MKIEEEEKEIKKKLFSALKNLIKITPESLVRTSDLGKDHDFSGALYTFKHILNLFNELNEANFDNMPIFVLRQIDNNIKAGSALFNKINAFKTAGLNNPLAVRNELIKEIQNYHMKQYEIIKPAILYSGAKTFPAEILTKRAQDAIKSIQMNLKESADIIEKLRLAAATVGTDVHYVHFAEAASSYKNRGKDWLRGTIIFAFFTLIFGAWNIWYYLFNSPNLTSIQTLQVGMAKLVVFGLLYYAALWCGKMYKAQQHNYVVNQHRHIALNTFETFVAATSDPQTKEAILLQAAQSIFLPQHSGFAPQELETSASPKIFEIIRNFIGTSNK